MTDSRALGAPTQADHATKSAEIVKVVPHRPCLCQVAVPDVDLRLVDAILNPVFLIFKILRSVGFCFFKIQKSNGGRGGHVRH